MEAEKPLVQFEDAVISVGSSPVIYDFDMTVNPGDFVYILGRVGSGKTSIIRTIIAENRIAGGRATVCGFDLSNIKSKDIPALRRKIGVVFQDFQLLMDRSVWENLEFVLKSTGWKDNMAISERIESVLFDVDMTKKAHKMPFQLSGGEQQRIAIARALLNSAPLILADEPTGNLDNVSARGIMQILSDINKNNNAAVIMVTHNERIIEEYPGRVFICEKENCKERI